MKLKPSCSGRPAATYKEFDALTRLHLSVFVRRVFAELNPGSPYLHNFHIDVLIEALEDVRFGRCQRLAVALPPRSLKSVVISIGLVAWLLGHDPSLKIISVSYSQELSDKLASDCRQVMQSAWYQRLFPATRLRQAARRSPTYFETPAGGGRFSTSVGGPITGFGADVIIIDDPMNPDQALSDAERNSGNNWVQHTLFTRLNDKRTGRIVWFNSGCTWTILSATLKKRRRAASNSWRSRQSLRRARCTTMAPHLAASGTNGQKVMRFTPSENQWTCWKSSESVSEA